LSGLLNMLYEILNQEGQVVNRISASAEYMQNNYSEEEYALVESPPEVPTVPRSLTMRQARIVLRRANLLSSIDTAIQNLPEPDRTEATIEWEYSNEVQRHNGFVAQLATLLGMSELDLDNLFITGAAL